MSIQVRAVFAGLGVTAAALTGCSQGESPSPSAPPPSVSLTSVYDSCLEDAKPKALLRLEDGGNTLLLELPPLNDNLSAACVLDMLETPSSVRAQIDNTPAGSLSETATVDGLTYTWTKGTSTATLDGQGTIKIIITTNAS